MDLHTALSDISAIRLQIAKTQTFRGYRSVPTAFSGFLAASAACIQAATISQPNEQLDAYLSLWIIVALAAVVAVGAEMVVRGWIAQSALAREATWLAVTQFAPCMIAGGLVTGVIAGFAPESAWMLPGLYQIFFSLGVFASYRLLPRPIFWVGAFYLAAGLCTLTLARGPYELSPWAMGLPFALGQFAAAAILYWTLEHRDDAQEG